MPLSAARCDTGTVGHSSAAARGPVVNFSDRGPRRIKQPDAAKPAIPLRASEVAAQLAYGGMKAPHKVKQPASDISARLRALTERFMIARPDVVKSLIKAIGGPKDAFDYTASWLVELRALWVKELADCTPDPVMGDVVSTPLRYSLIKRWLILREDPACGVIDWLRDGAPSGIALDIPDNGVFPPKADARSLNIDQLEEVAQDH